MSKAVHVAGIEDGLFEALVDRLVRAGATISNREDAEVVVHLGPGGDGDVVVAPDGATQSDSGLNVVLTDVIIPGWDSGWGNEDFVGLVHLVKNEDPHAAVYQGARHWVHVRDVTDALCTLVLAESSEIRQGTVNMCGRRPWTGDDVLDEARVLWNRYNDALNHTHSVESLSSIPSPVRGKSTVDVTRPDLGPLHSALISSGGEGWHPLVAMRTSLMEVIALSE